MRQHFDYFRTTFEELQKYNNNTGAAELAHIKSLEEGRLQIQSPGSSGKSPNNAQRQTVQAPRPLQSQAQERTRPGSITLEYIDPASRHRSIASTIGSYNAGAPLSRTGSRRSTELHLRRAISLLGRLPTLEFYNTHRRPDIIITQPTLKIIPASHARYNLRSRNFQTKPFELDFILVFKSITSTGANEKLLID